MGPYKARTSLTGCLYLAPSDEEDDLWYFADQPKDSNEFGGEDFNPRIRHDIKGPKAEGWDRKIYNRRHAEELPLQRAKRKATPIWVLLVPKSSKSTELGIPCDYGSGYQKFVQTFAEATRGRIKQQFPVGVALTITPTPINVDVAERFLSSCMQHQVRPRLVFHGTQPSNIQSIYDKGLLTPAKLHPEGHYTDAIWTAPSAQTSMGYCGKGKHMFACAVVDDRVGQSESAGVPSALDSEPAAPGKKVKDHEKRLGCNQHRRTRRPAEPNKQKKLNPVSYVHSWAVLVRDESLICPVLDIRWCSGGAIEKRHPVWQSNRNTQDTDHYLHTLAQAYEGEYSHPVKHDLRHLQHYFKRKAEAERRRLRADKHLMRNDAAAYQQGQLEDGPGPRR